MKSFIPKFALSLILIIVSVVIAKAQSPSPALWLEQTGFEVDSSINTIYIHLEWESGIVDENHPMAEGFKIYRSMIGYNEEPEDYTLVGTVYTKDFNDKKFTFTDEVKQAGSYLYYVKSFKGQNYGDISAIIRVYAFTHYCVNLNAAIIDFVSFPITIAIPGEKYVYEMYAKHRSTRVQGFVRYHLVEGPDGMTLDEKTGVLEWDVPKDADGNYDVKVRATSTEDKRAESIQQWVIRIANNDEIASLTDVYEIKINDNIKIYPNPVQDELKIYNPELINFTKIEIISLTGKIILSQELSKIKQSLITIPVSSFSRGTYIVKLISNNNIYTKKILVE